MRGDSRRCQLIVFYSILCLLRVSEFLNCSNAGKHSRVPIYLLPKIKGLPDRSIARSFERAWIETGNPPLRLVQ